MTLFIGKRLLVCGLVSLSTVAANASDEKSVDDTPTEARAVDGSYVSWREHIIDDPALSGIELSGSDGLEMADLDGDGFEDIVSVHESDTVYDGKPVGTVRIAWGSADPDRWELSTLASGVEAAAAEDVDIADANGDGHPDVVVACELAHLIYFQNPGRAQRTTEWPRVIPPIANERGSYIRAFFAELDEISGSVAVVAANKGGQNPGMDTVERDNISIYLLPANPLDGTLWREQVLGKVRIPINSQPVDLDGDGDLDIVGGSRGERRMLWFENHGGLRFEEHPIELVGTTGEGRRLTGFNMDYADLDGDGRLDIVSNEQPGNLVWLQRPASADDPWRYHEIGSMVPDSLVSVRLADIDDDGDLDAFAGAYSRGPRDEDGDVTVNDPLGGIAWFENPGGDPARTWTRHDVSRRKRGMYDKWLARDLDGDGDIDFVGTRGNSAPYDGVIWLEQVRTASPVAAFEQARAKDSKPMLRPPDR